MKRRLTLYGPYIFFGPNAQHLVIGDLHLTIGLPLLMRYVVQIMSQTWPIMSCEMRWTGKLGVGPIMMSGPS